MPIAAIAAMAPTDIVLHFQFSDDPNTDQRTMQVHQINDETLELYKFHHPNTGLTTGVTSIRRKNAITAVWENAGQIEWFSNTSYVVDFGMERVSMGELRKRKKPSSQSRSFKVNGSEYKWKRGENGTDMVCVSNNIGNWGKMIAQWTQDTLTLRVAERAGGFLDRVVVTCFLHLWLRRFSVW